MNIDDKMKTKKKTNTNQINPSNLMTLILLKR